jgi:hypothetical protein
VRWATLALIALAACNDVRDFGGRWTGGRVGDAAPLKIGPGTQATLQIDVVDTHGIRGQLSVDGLIDNAPIVSLTGAEADALSSMTFAGNPLRVFLAFAITRDSKGDATVMIALYDDDRVEVRALRGGDTPVYAIFALQRSTE